MSFKKVTALECTSVQEALDQFESMSKHARKTTVFIIGKVTKSELATMPRGMKLLLSKG